MSIRDLWRRNAAPTSAVLLVTLLLPAAAALAADHGWPRFTPDVWQALTRAGGTPTAVVFTTTDCASCVQALHGLADTLHAKGRPRGRLVVVMLDGPTLGAEQAASHHYQLADERYAYDGPDQPLRYRIDPTWRGETPYVVLVGRDGRQQRSVGPPRPQAVQALLQGSRGAH